MASVLELNCWVFGESSTGIFSVEITNTKTVGALKNQIKKQKQVFQDIDADSLDLWRVSIPDDEDFRKKFQTPVPNNQPPMSSMARLSMYFSDVPLERHLHIVVRPPVGTTISPGSSNKSNVNFVPYIHSHWSPRRDTVSDLYSVLLRENLVQVRGTPGCGKTTLMVLLHAYILNLSPSALVYTQDSWPPDEKGLDLIDRLRKVDPKYPRSDGITFLLFDDAQDSYEDAALWSYFFKGVADGHQPYRVVLFCSYGSPSSRPVSHRRGTPLALREASRISLWPSEGSIGILLKRSEFDEVVSRFERPLNLHPDLLDLIFDCTVGHVGAVIEMLYTISYQRVADRRHGAHFTVEDFYAENPTHKLVQSLAGGAFERGLPSTSDLKAQPDVVALFRELLRDGAVDIPEGEDEGEAIRKCHRHGWIHANQITSTDEEITRYTLPSPLHLACLSWRLKPTNDMPHFTSLYDMAVEAISKFKPSQLYIPIRRVGPSSTDTPPEAQYQDEFFRSIFSVTCGNVRLSPEFGTARRAHVAGHIDFFIPVVKWGIKLIRDGNWLEEYNSRFTQFGAYGAWLQSGHMTDYILLDCRTTIPRTQFPNIQNLFHVVFQDSYQRVVVYNNMSTEVKGPIILLENH